jgi:hypothetical protein
VARPVAAALCGLGPVPEGPVSCPVDLGISYRLWFTAGRTQFQMVTVGAGGCRVVTGLGRPRNASSLPPAFWATLSRAVAPPLPVHLPGQQ